MCVFIESKQKKSANQTKAQLNGAERKCAETVETKTIWTGMSDNIKYSPELTDIVEDCGKAIQLNQSENIRCVARIHKLKTVH